eukprot:TRINITY_DN25424_c0_g1_i1.p1 TRINITY_DN25424_c0_g1~~TRINITY_DN25424_c0_g1_i1.p1  ORF type:complete len:180 (+),score=35.95 TRINITY_DN25424_c0_g1_i1:417-956(+)
MASSSSHVPAAGGSATPSVVVPAGSDSDQVITQGVNLMLDRLKRSSDQMQSSPKMLKCTDCAKEFDSQEEHYSCCCKEVRCSKCYKHRDYCLRCFKKGLWLESKGDERRVKMRVFMQDAYKKQQAADGCPHGRMPRFKPWCEGCTSSKAGNKFCSMCGARSRGILLLTDWEQYGDLCQP